MTVQEPHAWVGLFALRVWARRVFASSISAACRNRPSVTVLESRRGVSGVRPGVLSAGSPGTTISDMDQHDRHQLEALLRLFQERGLDELLVEDGSFKVHLRRDEHASRPPDPERPIRRGRERPRPAPPPEPKRRARTVAVRSPLIGIFYRSPSPDSASFVEIGDRVVEGQTVCIVEAMKVFNEIKAEWSGRVAAIPAETGKLVQAGEPLIVLEFALEGDLAKEG